ncbi:MAG: hypothetical protein N2C12_06745, partial [Planctomycetales bacterium]
LASRYYQEGHWQLTAETFQLLVEQYPNHPLRDCALQWLVQYYSSGEAGCRASTNPEVQQVRAEEADLYPAKKKAPANGLDPRDLEQRMLQAKHWASKLRAADLLAHHTPAVQFPLAALYRANGQSKSAELIYQNMQRSMPQNAWWQSAASERQLLDNGELPDTKMTKPLLICRRAEEKPLLDGQLNESFWTFSDNSDATTSPNTARLSSPYRDDKQWPAAIQIAFDDEFLYCAVQCKKAPGREYETDEQPRSRDANLSKMDRVDILIDIDRDFTTWYQLTVDYRGWTHETCWHDDSWNPEWFVAAQTTGQFWTCEIAIPLTELSKNDPDQPRLWAVGLQRTVPGIGFQSWSRPASTSVYPAGFGYLNFDNKSSLADP